MDKDFKNQIKEYSIKIGNIKISNDTLLDTIQKNFISEFSRRLYSLDYHQEGLLLIANKSTAKEIIKANNGQYAGKVLGLAEKSDWYQLGGRNKLEFLLQKAELSKADRAKISTYIRAEAEHFKALVGMAYIIPWLISQGIIITLYSNSYLSCPGGINTQYKYETKINWCNIL
ncbi:MAG: hypothetical protein AB4368_23550 [Xenococcaceae cyanobacterium]